MFMRSSVFISVHLCSFVFTCVLLVWCFILAPRYMFISFPRASHGHFRHVQVNWSSPEEVLKIGICVCLKFKILDIGLRESSWR